MRMLSGLTMLSVAVVAAIVLFSGQDNLVHALRPLERSSSAALNAHAASPLLAQRLAVDQTFHDLYTAARLAVVSGQAATAAELRTALAQENPEAKVGQPLPQGGISVRLLEHGQLLELCALTSQGYHCSDEGLTGSSPLSYGQGATLQAARRQALA